MHPRKGSGKSEPCKEWDWFSRRIHSKSEDLKRETRVTDEDLKSYPHLSSRGTKRDTEVKPCTCLGRPMAKWPLLLVVITDSKFFMLPQKMLKRSVYWTHNFTKLPSWFFFFF